MTDFADTAGRYRLDSRIATGGMGEVWRATDTSLGREVAVKLLKTEYADDPVFRSRFETEARHAAALHHPGVAAVYDVGEREATDGSGHPRPFLVMELVEGQPLSSLISAGRDLDPVAVRDLLAQVGDALGAAHRAGIVHRDVKPANLIVTPAGKIKVTDFGIARAADGVGITRTGAVMGTPQYLSPEQAEGRPATAASDVYALGVVAYECLVGRRPFDADSPVATALAHIREPVPTLPARVPADLAAVVTRALAKNPADRYADGAAFAAALRDPATAAVRVPPPVPPVVAPPADDSRTQVLAAAPYDPPPVVPVPPATSTTHVADDQRTNPWPLVFVVLLVVALAVVVTLLLTGGDDDDEPASGPTSTTASSRPTTEATSEPTTPGTTFVNDALYIGQPIDQVEADLRALGFQVERNGQANDDPDRDGTVTAVNPSGDVEPGETIRVSYYEDAPEPTSDPPTSEPTSDPPPTSEPTTEPPTSEPTVTESPAVEVPTEGETIP
ncbi:serine/threonine protein kinase [Nocardioides sp.]|uniref:serine/threonine protein kinase n=1 Tax=Nocardioides sp. TaxID=35761 RepID=UPI00271F8423|nr:serine/threonine protein kinase [Nocardioides sp.]MDO9456877.1 serine/threonine protein kinase [Nocardioides sp.]